MAADGSPVDLDVGTKLSGRIGSWSIGTLAVRQAAYDDIDASELLVSRIQHDVLAESKVGFIVTSGDPRSNIDNTLVGFDFLYSNTKLPGGGALDAEAWVQKTETEGLSGDDMAYSLGFNLPNNAGFRGGVQFREVQENFKPALGFVSRNNVRDYDANTGYKHFFGPSGLGRWLQSINTGIDMERIEEIGNGLQSASYRLRPLELVNHSNDSLQFRVQRNKEVVDNAFRIFSGNNGDVIIGPGDYTFDEYTLAMDTGGYRELSAGLDFTSGEFYDGDRVNINSSVTWRASPKLTMSVRYDWNNINLPQGDFISRLIIADMNSLLSR